jgi:two-component system sensor kinase FixL
MSWITVIWSMIASACLTLAGIHLLVWAKQRQAWDGLLFSVTSVATAVVAFCELAMMRSATAAEFAATLRWGHVPAAVFLISLVLFVRLHLHAGRPWLAWATCSLRALALLLNFVHGENLNYLQVTGLQRVAFLGEWVSVGEGPSNPLMLVGQASLALFFVFMVDAAIAVWRRGDRRQALFTVGSIVFFALAVCVHAVLVLWQFVHAPFTGSLFFMPIVLAMGYEMSRDMLRATQLSKELRDSEERMTMAVQAAGVGIFMWGPQPNQVWGTDRWRQLFGFAAEGSITQDQVIARIDATDRDAVQDDMRRAMAGQADHAGEYCVTLPGGSKRWIAARGKRVPESAGRPARLLGAVIDITERKQGEADALRQRSELAHLSRMAMLGELSGSIAHELNQPLTAILSNAQAGSRFLAHAPVDLEQLRDILADIVEQDKRAGEIIYRLRLLLKKGEVQQQPLDVNDAVQEGLKLIRSDLLNQGVTTRTHLAATLPRVSADRVQVQQVLVNLVMNASDAMNGSAERTITVRTELGSDGAVCICVADHGEGIAPDQLEQVFEPFFSTKPHGLGLGLSVCRTIVAAHGGRLWASRNPQRGATFHFTLPVARGAAR